MYGQFKSFSRAAKRGHIAVLKSKTKTTYFRKVKSDKVGSVKEFSRVIYTATFLNTGLNTKKQKLCLL